MIPEFSQNGELPPGVYGTDVEEIERVLGFDKHRKGLKEGLIKAVENLRRAGVKRIWINGSFVTSEEFPNDIDGCWDPFSVAIEKLDPVLFDDGEGRSSMKEKYGVDFVPNVVEGNSGEYFYKFFQKNRSLEPKGILLISFEG